MEDSEDNKEEINNKKSKNNEKEKKSKNRTLSPSFKRGSLGNRGKNTPENNNDKCANNNKLDLNLEMCGEEDNEDLANDDEENNPENDLLGNISPEIKTKKRLSMPEQNRINELKNNLSTQKRISHITAPTDHHHHHHLEKTNALPDGHIKKMSAFSQAGKAEDGFTKINQDSYLVITKEYKLNDFNMFGVLDGHGLNGHLVSNFAVRYLTTFFQKNKKINTLTDEDSIYYRLKKNSYDIISRACRHIERDIAKSDIDATYSGTTCCMVFQVGEKIICGNIGDSRAIIVKKNIHAKIDNNDNHNNSNKKHKKKKNNIENILYIKPLSIDQKPNSPGEKERIESHGGIISQYEENGEVSGPFRVWKKDEMVPGIAMSRSIGDLVASTLGVIPEPIFTEEVIDSNTKFIIIASDGIWEFLENNKVAEIVLPFYEKGDPDGACKELIRQATEWWNNEDVVVDDITVIALFF